MSRLGAGRCNIRVGLAALVLTTAAWITAPAAWACSRVERAELSRMLESIKRSILTDGQALDFLSTITPPLHADFGAVEATRSAWSIFFQNSSVLVPSSTGPDCFGWVRNPVLAIAFLTWWIPKEDGLEPRLGILLMDEVFYTSPGDEIHMRPRWVRELLASGDITAFADVSHAERTRVEAGLPGTVQWLRGLGPAELGQLHGQALLRLYGHVQATRESLTPARREFLEDLSSGDARIVTSEGDKPMRDVLPPGTAGAVDLAAVLLAPDEEVFLLSNRSGSDSYLVVVVEVGIRSDDRRIVRVESAELGGEEGGSE